MPKNPHLFGKYLRNQSAEKKLSINKSQFTRYIPVKAYGRQPSRASQQGLFHDEDYNFYTKVHNTYIKRERRILRPYVLRRNIFSKLLNYHLKNVEVTQTALEAMERIGGFDEYILRTPPQEIRSTFAEQLRQLMYYYMKNPEIREWGLPSTLMMKRFSQRDPWYARHRLNVSISRFNKAIRGLRKSTSPYYLPPTNQITPERQTSSSLETPPNLNLWWKESPQLERAFRRRLGEARCFETPRASTRTPGSYYKGRGRGGGGKHKQRKVSRKHKIMQYKL